MSKLITKADKDYRFLMISNSRGKTNHIVYYDLVTEQFLPTCRAQRGLKLEEGLKSRRYILSKYPVEGAGLCKACVSRLLDNDLIDIEVNFERHLIELPRPEGSSKAKPKPLVERGMSHEEYARKVNSVKE